MTFKSYFLFLLANLLSLAGLRAQGRISETINSSWLFYKGDTTKITAQDNWKTVSIPHTWNTEDALDDEPGYYRGDGWYKKTIYVPASWKDKTVYLYFEGAGQTADVFVNRKPVGKHLGGYTFFSIPVSTALTFTAAGNTPNEIVVRVNNSLNEDLPPPLATSTSLAGCTGMCI